MQILKLRGQAEEQEASLKAQEEEVHSKKRELEVLVEEEVKLNNDIKKSQRDIEMLVQSLADVEKLLEETTGKCGEYEELETHLIEATKRFDQVLESSDYSLAQNVPELYLEPIRYTFSEPDFSVLDRPRDIRPPRPEAPSALSPMANGHGHESDDPFSNQSVSPAEANNLFNNDDAFASNKPSGVSRARLSGHFFFYFLLFCFQASFDPFSNFSSSSGFVSGASSAFTTPNNDPFAAFGAASAFPSQFVSFSFILFLFFQGRT